jgi:hypothetical protein
MFPFHWGFGRQQSAGEYASLSCRWTPRNGPRRLLKREKKQTAPCSIQRAVCTFQLSRRPFEFSPVLRSGGLATAAARFRSAAALLAAGRLAATVTVAATITMAAVTAALGSAARGSCAASGFRSAAGLLTAGRLAATAAAAATITVAAVTAALGSAARLGGAAARLSSAARSSGAARGLGRTTRGFAAVATEDARLRIRRAGNDEQASHEQGRQHNAGFHGRNS